MLKQKNISCTSEEKYSVVETPTQVSRVRAEYPTTEVTGDIGMHIDHSESVKQGTKSTYRNVGSAAFPLVFRNCL